MKAGIFYKRHVHAGDREYQRELRPAGRQHWWKSIRWHKLIFKER
ncbi:hypothetical protein BDE36_2628 [Arcticibacter tournemirensis]|nr:hypothetical protein [Arcticibacter tournemirensis]TQM50864.1 hypothetical protein BDE36_2628 [Arcticibacter tournemirensis]